MELGLGIVLLFVVNFWGVLILIGLEKLQKRFTNYHGSDLEGQRDKSEDHGAEDVPTSNGRLV